MSRDWILILDAADTLIHSKGIALDISQEKAMSFQKGCISSAHRFMKLDSLRSSKLCVTGWTFPADVEVGSYQVAYVRRSLLYNQSARQLDSHGYGTGHQVLDRGKLRTKFDDFLFLRLGQVTGQAHIHGEVLEAFAYRWIKTQKTAQIEFDLPSS